MKLLFLTNFYPPASRGGYEQWCQEVAEGLRNKGHDVVILTSRHGRHQIPSPEPDWIHRTLYLKMELASFRNSIDFFTTRQAREKANLEALQVLIDKFQPDMILVWGMWNISRSIPALAEHLMPGRVAYYFGDYWPMLPDQDETYWVVPARNRLTSIPKKVLRPFAQRILANQRQQDLEFSHVIFSSAFLRDEYIRNCIDFGKSTIIYGAVDTSPFLAKKTRSVARDGSITLLYVGRLTQEKGVHTCIQALGALNKQNHQGSLNLVIVGSGEKEYESYLFDLAREEQVADCVKFLGVKQKSELPEIYRDADIFLFPSIWPEPFGRVLVEAMAAGIPVIGVPVGGAAEILCDGENGLLFQPGDAAELAERIILLVESPDLWMKLTEAGRITARDRFDIARMVAEIEVYLQDHINP